MTGLSVTTPWFATIRSPIEHLAGIDRGDKPHAIVRTFPPADMGWEMTETPSTYPWLEEVAGKLGMQHHHIHRMQVSELPLLSSLNLSHAKIL